MARSINSILIDTRTCPDCGGGNPRKRLRLLKGGAEKKATAVNGEPAPIIEKGTSNTAIITGGWATTIALSISSDNPIGIAREIKGSLKDEDVAGFMTVTEHALMHGLALGALDSAYEVETENSIEAPAGPAPESEELAARHGVITLATSVTNRILGFSELPYQAATDQFLQLKILTRRSWDALEQKAKLRSFTIANASKQSMIETAQRELARQVARGADLRDFRQRVAKRMESAGWTPANPSHVECLPADTMVSGAVVRAAHRRWHEGTMVEVVTASGRKFSTTTNHPMLTRRGWVATGELKQGDDLIGHDGQQRQGTPGDHDVACPPALISEVFRAVSEVGDAERIQSVRDDFHGDGADGYVDVAHARGLLRFGSFTALHQPIEDLLFAKTDAPASRFCAQCGGLIMVTNRCGFCDRANSGAAVAQDSSDSIATSLVLTRQLQRAGAGNIERDDLFGGQVGARAHVAHAVFESPPSFPEMTSDAGISDDCSNPRFRSSDVCGDSDHALASGVRFDRVLALRVYRFKGHVFNLSTESGYFQIDGLYTGNTIFRTNVQRSYTAGRVEHAMKPSVLRARPFWQVVTVNDGPPRQRENHRRNHGKTLRADNPIWATKMMPFGFSCRCRFTTKPANYAGPISDDLEGVPDQGFTAGIASLV